MAWTDKNSVDHAAHTDIVLEPFDVSLEVRQAISAPIGTGSEPEICAKLDSMCNELIASLRMCLTMAKHEEKFETYYFPLNAWQHIKHDYAPVWFIQKFPVKYDELRVRVRGDVSVCPHADVKWKEDPKPHIDFISKSDKETLVKKVLDISRGVY